MKTSQVIFAIYFITVGIFSFLKNLTCLIFAKVNFGDRSKMEGSLNILSNQKLQFKSSKDIYKDLATTKFQLKYYKYDSKMIQINNSFEKSYLKHTNLIEKSDYFQLYFKMNNEQK